MWRKLFRWSSSTIHPSLRGQANSQKRMFAISPNNTKLKVRVASKEQAEEYKKGGWKIIEEEN